MLPVAPRREVPTSKKQHRIQQDAAVGISNFAYLFCVRLVLDSLLVTFLHRFFPPYFVITSFFISFPNQHIRPTQPTGLFTYSVSYLI
jgi:hypothetical protein